MIKKIAVWLFAMLLMCLCAFADDENMYPQTLGDGNYVCVDGGMGVGIYADKSSVVAQSYSPPYYQLAINVVRVEFYEDYWRRHETYVGSPYRVIDYFTVYFRYNWNKKTIEYLSDDDWLKWDINRDYSHAEGDPFVPLTAETAFVSAYKRRFFNDTMGYSPVLNENLRVIDEKFYAVLGI